MDHRARQFARAHWAALDAALTLTLTRDEADRCREGVRWSLGHIASKYAKRLTDAVGDDARRAGLDAVARELATALNAAWATPRASARPFRDRRDRNEPDARHDGQS